MTPTASTKESHHPVRAIHLASVAALGGFLFGFDTAVINGAVSAVREDFGMGSFLTGFAVASALLGDFALASAAGGAGEELWFGLAAWIWTFMTLAIPALAYGVPPRPFPNLHCSSSPRANRTELSRCSARSWRPVSTSG